MENIIEQVSNVIEMPDNIKDFFKKNKDTILATGDKEFIESAQVLNLIEIEKEEDPKAKEIRELEEKLNQLKGVGA
jgi:hypothetical protein